MVDGISIRLGSPDDEHYILNTWLETLRSEWPDMRSGDYFGWMRERIAARAFEGLRVHVAHPEDSPTVIWGFVVADQRDETVHFLYVRANHRGRGIAKALVSELHLQTQPWTITAVTDAVRTYKKRHPEALRYVPL